MPPIKIILWDVDGVLIRVPHYYSVELENQGYQNAVQSLNSFYLGTDNHLCLEGKADSAKMIIPYVKQLGWKGPAKKLLQLQFHYESRYLDRDLISRVNQLRHQGIGCYLCTDQDRIRAKYLLKDLDFQNSFDGHFISCEIGYRKCHDQFWTQVLNRLREEGVCGPGISPNQIVFFDDVQINIDTALMFGIQAYLFKDIHQLTKDLESSTRFSAHS